MAVPYVELHAHSAFSFLDGASAPEELAEQAAALGHPALALTDHDGLCGSLAFAHAARAAGVRPVTGAELTLDDGSHLTLLVATAAGYANLCRLITLAHAHTRDARDRRAVPPSLDPAHLGAHAEGLVCLTGCARDGHVARLVAAGRRVVLYDQRGHGASTLGPGAPTVDQLGEDLAAVLDAVDARDAVVAGHSMGGHGALVLGMKHPDVFSVVYAMSPAALALLTTPSDTPICVAATMKGSDVACRTPAITAF